MMKQEQIGRKMIRFHTLARNHTFLTGLLIVCMLGNAGGFAQGSRQFVEVGIDEEVLASISADSLRGHISFLAADLLGGRNTPSYGLDVAAEYIAAQCRRAGLKPVGDGGYFQTVSSTVLLPNRDEFRFSLQLGERIVDVSPESFEMNSIEGVRIDGVPVAKISYQGRPLSDDLDVKGRVVFTELPGEPMATAERLAYYQGRRSFMGELASLDPLLIVTVERHDQGNSEYFESPHLEDRDGSVRLEGAEGLDISVNGDGILDAFDEMPEGLTEAKLWVTLKAPIHKEVRMRNVAGLLEGSDPELKDSYILLTAHYDGTGPRPGAMGEDRIWNAANDNASGTATVLEIAAALSQLRDKPKRSLVFIAFYGEEKGLLGSRYYGEHPLFPIEKTIACVNLEQLGRTDSSYGDQTNRASLTGFDFSDIWQIFQAAGKRTGIEVYKDGLRSDAYFNRSDNKILAELGVPAHTLCVAFSYSDYHGAADHWDKIDYQNLARTSRMIAVALLMMANSEEVPGWNAGNPRAWEYLKAWEKMHPEL